MNAARTAAAITAGAGLILLAIGFYLFRNRVVSIRTWQPVEAQVVRSWMEEHETGDSTERSTSYSAHYELAYTVNGESMRSTARSQTVFSASSGEVQARLDRHSAGTRGVVHVNPDNPSQISLNMGMNAATLALPLWMMLPGASLLLFAIALWFLGTPAPFW